MMCNYNTHAIRVCKRMPSESFSRGKICPLAQSMIYHQGESKIRGGSLSFMAEEWPLNVEVPIAMPVFLGFFIYEVCMSYTYTYSYFTIDYFLYTKPPVKVTNVDNLLTKASMWVKREEK